jgi:hypothetical protein
MPVDSPLQIAHLGWVWETIECGGVSFVLEFVEENEGLSWYGSTGRLVVEVLLLFCWLSLGVLVKQYCW